MKNILAVLAASVCVLGSEYLGNKQRTGDAGCDVPAKPVLQWKVYERHAPRHAWKEPGRELQFIDFDYADQCTFDDSSVYFGSSADHTVRSLALRTGREQWVFYTGGPVRFAPAVWNGRVYVASDDGLIYCLDAAKGTELWRFRPGRGTTMCIGNEQLVSRWPARSGVLIDTDGMKPGHARLYCTGGMWSRDGVVVACLDAVTGKVLWKNDTSGFHFMRMPHASGFGGVAPQGYLVRYKDVLYVATGRAEPAFFNAETGKLIYYETGVGYKPHYPGGSWVMAAYDRLWFKRRQNHVEENVRYGERDPGPSYTSGIIAWSYATGKPEMALTDKTLAAVKGDVMIMAGYGPLIRVSYNRLKREYTKYWRNGKTVAIDPHLSDPKVEYIGPKLQRLKRQLGRRRRMPRQGKRARRIPAPAPNWMTPLPMAEWKADIGRVYTLMIAGDKVLAGGRGRVTLLDLDTGLVLWHRKIEGNARGLAVAPGRFVVSSTAGILYCFAEGQRDETREWRHTPTFPPTTPSYTRIAKAILADTGIRAGYCLQLGAGTGALTFELIRNSDLIVYCLEPDARKVNALRRVLDDAGWLGVRAQVVQGSFDRLPFNPYLANLVVCGEALGSGVAAVGSRAGGARELYRVTRPYGGVAYCLGRADTASIRRWLAQGGIPSREVSAGSEGIIVRRGPLPGAGEWTHAYADIGRSCSSDDDIVRLPVAMLWWGGPGPARIVSRHWRAPVPLFAQGILFVQGQHDVFAVDAYNGREIWNRHIEGVGSMLFFDHHRTGSCHDLALLFYILPQE